MAVDTQKVTLGFQTEVRQLLSLMINSLYSNKEIFLRELISNAADAADKLRFLAMTNSALYEQDADLRVWVDVDNNRRIITITDNGIGMTREEIIQNLGTIAKSGTREFLSTLTGDKARDSNLIGQFGVGFYSAFIVADKVVVTSRYAGTDPETATRWTSDGKGEYAVETVRKLKRGTEVTLYLKATEDEFLNSWHVRHLIKKYSDHITLPVIMKKEKPAETDKDKVADKKDDKIIDVPEEEVVNAATALWTLTKQEIKDEQYKEFYKSVAHDFEDPLTWSHNKVEGKLEYTSLLYIPARAPFDMWNAQKPKGLKLYVKRVFIMDEVQQFLPNYLRFIRGIVDSNDLSLNISREILQDNQVVEAIRSGLTKRVLGMLEQMASNEPEKYKTFWKEFGQVIKEGVVEDFANKEQILKLLRFSSTHDTTENQEVALADYVVRMQDKQTKIYYIAADTFNAALHSPHLEIFRRNNIEVLLLFNRIDEWFMAQVTEFSDKGFQSIARGNLDLKDLITNAEDTKAIKNKEDAAEQFKDFLQQIKTGLADKIKDVRFTERLTNSPSCVVTDEHDMSPHMERIMRSIGQTVPTNKPILELNPNHAMIQKLQQIDVKSAIFTDWAWLLFEQAVLAEGGQLTDPAAFVERMNKLLQCAKV